MRLHPDVYFKRYGEYTYLRHVGQQKDYLYNEIAYDILSFLEERPDCPEEQIFDCLLSIYDIEEEDELKKDVRDFLEDLYQSGILLLENREKDVLRKESIREFIQENCCVNHRLLNVCLELTYRCNEKCIHCYIDDPSRAQEELCFQDYKKLLDELKELGCMGILLTGGEPSLHPDFLKIAEYAKAQRLLVDIYTNGLAIDDELLDHLIALKPNSISFSFYGGTASVHDKITGIKGSFEKSLRTMMLCKCAGIDTYIKTVVMKQNAEAYEELLRLGKRLGITVSSSLSIVPTHGGRSAEPFRLSDLEAYRKILSLEYKYGYYTDDRDGIERPEQICASGLNTLSVDPFGGIHPCNASPVKLGNIREASIRSVWETSRELQAIRKLRYDDISEKCGSCPHKPWCGICMGGALRENGRLAPCTDTCLIAEANHREYRGHS